MKDIQQLEQEIAQLKNDNQQLLKDYWQEKRRLEKEVRQLRADYDAIRNSRFWRMTAPARKIVEKSKITIYKYPFLRLPYKFISITLTEGFGKTRQMMRERKEFQRNLKSGRKEYQKLQKARIEECKLKVSIIVPNYNHEKYLRKRLDSIYAQSYQNYEVLLLDDCSSDNSREILKEYAQKHPQNTRLLFNTHNSGGVFRQWKKGIQAASGDLCWMAESDDFADPNFLETLVPFFADESVMLAYAHMNFWQNGKACAFTYENYLSPIKHQVWKQEYVRSAYQEVKEALGIKNVIPNASGVVFRKPNHLSIFEDTNFLNMKICGDWIFYLNLIVGGRIAYSPLTNNYFNLHDDSSSKITHTKECYYQEHAAVAETIASFYPDCEEALRQNREIIHAYYGSVMQHPNEEEFQELYNDTAIQNALQHRKSSILISIYAFSLGGGEIFPIRLANALKRMGYPITIHCLSTTPRQQQVVEMLDSEIPIVYAATETEMEALLREFHFDVINTHHQSNQHLIGEMYYRNPSILKGIRHIATMHGMYEALPDTYIMDYLPIIDDSVDVWTRVAEKNLEPFKKAHIYYEDKHVRIPNGISIPETFTITREELSISKEAFVLCLASRALPQKGWLEAIEAVTDARNKSHKDMHLLLLGSGEMYDLLKKQGVPEYVHLLGFVRDTCQYYHISDMGFLPSYFSGESMPLTIIEAFCVGKPVIASNIGETPWLLKDEASGKMAGQLFDLVNGTVPVKEVGDILAAFAVDSEKYQAAARIASKKAGMFDIQNVAKEYLKIFHSESPSAQ
ncbi:MAG: glycosyltransferase [bacterium]|nr:glycosyltransferase [bacterium]